LKRAIERGFIARQHCHILGHPMENVLEPTAVLHQSGLGTV
jgi:hypothetical protein